MKQSRIGLSNYALSGVLLSFVACTGAGPIETEQATSASSGHGHGHHTVISDAVVRQWTQHAVDTIASIAPPVAPFPSTRAMAAVEVAMFEAVNAITGKYEPYFGTVTAADGASPQAAAAVAAHGVLKWLFPPTTAALDAKLAATLATIPDGQSKTDGIAAGQAAAAAMIAARTGDGAAPAAFFNPTAPGAAGEWQRTPSCGPPGGAFAHWKNVKPFGIQSSTQFRADAPPSLTSKKYARDFQEVQLVGSGAAGTNPNRSTDRENVARVYAAQPPHVGWNSVALQILATRNDDISKTARTLAMMNLSLSDAHITVFESKYFFDVWRPETAIPRAAEDGNDRTTAGAFSPFVVTPCFPSYPSAHGAGAGVASRILEKAYGDDGFSLNISHPAVPGVVLHYTNLEDIVSDVSDARVFGGIHFRYDQDAAEKQGKRIANYNLENVLQRADDDDDDDGDDDDHGHDD